MTDTVENCFETKQGPKGNWPVSSAFAAADHRMSMPTVATFSHRQAPGGVTLNLLTGYFAVGAKKEKEKMQARRIIHPSSIGVQHHITSAP